MTMTADDLVFLTSASGESLLAQLAQEDLSEKQHLPLLMRLRREYSPEQAGAALSLAQLRQKAVDKFGPAAQKMFFTPDALEQASHPLVSAYRSQRVQGQQVIDAGCSIGADSLALAQAGHAVTGVDLDPLRVALARLNAAALGLDAQFVVGDVTEGLPQGDSVFFDPARRDSQGRRLHEVEQYLPPLSTLKRWDAPCVAVKLSPAVALSQVATYGGAVEFISVTGDLKEAILWLGYEGLPAFRATLLTATDQHHWDSGPEKQVAPLDAPREWLLEPDPALLRAGLVGDLAVQLGAAQLDATIAYLTHETRPESSWVRAWRVRDWMPFNLKRLRAYLRENNVGHVTVKKRGFPMTPDEIIPRLKLKGSASCTLVLTRLEGEPIVMICENFS
jgi:SAM-dependent methyltransferase